MKAHPSNLRLSGSALIAVLFAVTVLSAITGIVISNVKNRRGVVHQSAAWQESLAAAEAGVHQAMAQLHQGMVNDALPTQEVKYLLDLPHSGISSNTARASYTITPKMFERNGAWRRYYYIDSNGTVRLNGPRGIGADIRDLNLRKLDRRGQCPGWCDEENLCHRAADL
jgi:hypothetical protein